MGHGSLWLLFAISAIRALGGGVQSPAIGALLPQIVPGDKLTKVNATKSSIQAAVTLISPMLSGALMTLAPLEIIFFIDVITAAIAVCILLFLLEVPTHAKSMSKQAITYFGDMREGIAYVLRHDFVRTFCLFKSANKILYEAGKPEPLPES